MDTPTWHLEHQDPPGEGVAEALRACLSAHNEALAGRPRATASLAWIARDAQGARVGGLLAEHAWQWLYIQALWVNADRRGRGAGRALVDAAEAWGRARDAVGIMLETADFQAPGFYERLGFTVCGQVADLPPGATTYFMTKRLTS